MRLAVVIISLCTSLLLTACANTQYKEFIGGKVLVGNGGTREVVNGIDIWENGTPPSRYKVIGIIEDERLNGPIHKASRLSDLADEAKTHGGDGLIILSQGAGAVVNGSSTTYINGDTMDTYSSSVASSTNKLKTKATVIKYQ